MGDAFTEDFEAGAAGQLLSTATTAFDYFNGSTTASRIVFTSGQAASGSLAATLPPETGEYYEEIVKLAGATGTPVTTAPWRIVWHHRFTRGDDPRFTRSLFSLWGSPEGTAVSYGPSGDYWFQVFVSFDGPEEPNFRYVVRRSTGPGEWVDEVSHFAAPPEATWLRCELDYTPGAVGLRMENATTGQVYADVSGALDVDMGPRYASWELWGAPFDPGWQIWVDDYTATGAPALRMLHPLRLHPRDDGLALGPKRLWPRPESTQRGPRLFGGYR